MRGAGLGVLLIQERVVARLRRASRGLTAACGPKLAGQSWVGRTAEPQQTRFPRKSSAQAEDQALTTSANFPGGGVVTLTSKCVPQQASVSSVLSAQWDGLLVCTLLKVPLGGGAPPS